MSVRSIATCDGCGTEAATTATGAAGWHTLQLHDLTIGAQIQVDICGDCCKSMGLADLLRLAGR